MSVGNFYLYFPSKESALIYSYKTVEGMEDFTKDITRKNLSVQEHYRWNAYMIMNGFVPGTIPVSPDNSLLCLPTHHTLR